MFEIITKLEEKIDLSKDIQFNINTSSILLNKVENEFLNAKSNIVESSLKFLSFGFIDFDDKYVKIRKKKQLQIDKIKNEINSFNQELNNNNKLVEQIEIQLIEAMSDINELLLNKQDELTRLSSRIYIDDYKRNLLLNEISSLISKKDIIFNYTKANLDGIKSFYKESVNWVSRSNDSFMINEKIKEKSFLDTIESNPLTNTQRDAVLTNENNNLILAGAGSGKTSVVVAKVIYLIKNEVVKADKILILAFNKNAQEELLERFEKHNIEVMVKTFHSFGLQIIADAYDEKPTLCKMSESSFQMTKFINETIITLASNNKEFLQSFINLLAFAKIPYKDPSSFNNKGEYYDYQKNYDMKTLKHKVLIKNDYQKKNLITLQSDTVKSYQELLIGNFLTLNGIEYSYEAPYKYKTSSKEFGQYKPDFYLPQFDIYIEHFGINRNGDTAPYIDKVKYNNDIQWKRELHKTKDTILVETFSYEHSEDTLLDGLKEKLNAHNVVFRELDHNEILEILNTEIKEGWFTKLFSTFLNHYKSNMYKMDDIKKKAKENRDKKFLEVFEKIYYEYTGFQKKHNCIDFDDMIVKAINAIDKGLYSHNFKHIFIDEFQDISTTRSLLIKKLTKINNSSITAVGDDWQSINRFAGSNIKIIQKFEEVFGISKVVALDYTFRFDNKVSEVAASFIQKNPNQLKKDIKTIKIQEANKFSILLYWLDKNIHSEFNNIVSMIYKKEKSNQISIMVLSRYKFVFKEIQDQFINKYNNITIKFSTIHGSKGNEADYVIVLGINDGKMGFPSRIEDDTILNLVVPEGDEFEDAEERRLFYVALTRTKKTVFLLSNKDENSIFIKELLNNYSNDIFEINKPTSKPEHCPDCTGGLLIKKHSKNNSFYACNNFPRCRFIKNIHLCKDCNSEIIKNIVTNMAECSNNNCNFKSKLCDKCSGYMINKVGKYGNFIGCSNYPRCNNTNNI